ncbi:unnamed protein product [Rotaria sp. Silwood2]|nr:unnamed protein product [Rotaria sp. Silwood2]
MNEEELEVLKSIYESDPNFSIINDNTFQYKYILDDDRFYLVEIHWPEGYPNVIPKINLDLFSNRLLFSFFLKISNINTTVLSSTTTTPSISGIPVIKKEQLSKAQKRRQWNNRVAGDDGQRPRGHDWIDIVRHLSQTGNKIQS